MIDMETIKQGTRIFIQTESEHESNAERIRVLYLYDGFSSEESNIIMFSIDFFKIIYVNFIGVTSHLKTIIKLRDLSLIIIDAQELRE
jgi:hypothetical protein